LNEAKSFLKYTTEGNPNNINSCILMIEAAKEQAEKLKKLLMNK
jgi:hypothetical protein